MNRQQLLHRTAPAWASGLLVGGGPLALFAQTNALAEVGPTVPDVGLSLVRLVGALALVIALFLGGAWLYRNWQRLAARRGHSPQLQILEARPLGQRQALYLVSYRHQRLLLAASPAGINLISHLPSAAEADLGQPVPPEFEATLAQQQFLQPTP